MKALVRQTAIYTLANIVSRSTAVVALLIFPFILTPADYGAFGLVMTIAALTQVTVPLEVSQGMARYYGTAPEDEKPGYGAAAWWFSALMLCGAGMAALLIARPLSELVFGSGRYLGVFRSAVPLLIGFSLFYFLQSLCRWKFMTRAYVLLSLCYSGLTLALGVLLALIFSDALQGLVIGQAIGMSVTVAIAFALLRGDLLRPIDGAKLGQMLRFSYPLVPASLSFFAGQYASRLILNGVADLADVGIFIFASQIAGLAGIAIIGVQSSLTPYVMSHYDEPETPGILARFFEGFTSVAVLLCLALGLLAPPVLTWLAPGAYVPAGSLVILLCPPAVMLSMYIFWPGFAIAKRTDQQLWVSIAAGVSAVAANAVLIPLLGIAGAAVASIVSAGVLLVLWYVLSNRHYPVPIRWSRVWVVIAIYVLAGVAGSVLASVGTMAVAARVAILVLASIAVLVFGPVTLRDVADVTRISRRLR